MAIHVFLNCSDLGFFLVSSYRAFLFVLKSSAIKVIFVLLEFVYFYCSCQSLRGLFFFNDRWGFDWSSKPEDHYDPR
ncbi:hypothetical protein V6Z12_A05G088900 [Gossypium hirsutum]